METLEKVIGVVLKGKSVPAEQVDKLILKKVKRILDKLSLVSEAGKSTIVTSSRIPYLGKQYYAEVIYSETIQQPEVMFNHSQFRFVVNLNGDVQGAILEALEGSTGLRP